MDYSELVKSLRICVKSNDCIGCIKNADGTEFGCKPLGDSELILEAADAIEELQSRAESLMADVKTNADRIRQLTDAELARWIATTADDNCPDTAHERYCDNRCGECWLDWLKSPVEVDNG